MKHKKSKECKPETKSDLTIDQQLDVIKKEMESINKAIGNLYRDYDVKKKIAKGTEMMQGSSSSNQNKYMKMVNNKMVDYSEDKKINVCHTSNNVIIKDEFNAVKEEFGQESHVNNDEGINIFDIDKRETTNLNENNNKVNTFNKELKIKKEIVFEPEICDVNVNIENTNIKIEFTQDSDNYEEYLDTTVKTEPYSDDYVCSNSKVKSEIDSEENIVHSINNYNISKDTDDLYKDHIVKEELVIGPEQIQQAMISFPHPSKKKSKTIRTTKPENKLTDKLSQEYICNYCCKRLKSRDNIIKHLSLHQKALHCPECDKKFSLECNLRRHRQIHSNHAPYECDVCKKTFQRIDYLQFHMKSRHSSGTPSRPPSACDLCKKVFSSKCSRDHHKMYACPMNINKKKFSRNKLYVCDICDKSYPYRSSLSSHILRYHMKKSLGPLHQCDYCGKKYVKKHNLQCHIQSNHLYILPYKCKKCGEEFKWHCALATHMKKEHGHLRQKILLG